LLVCCRCLAITQGMVRQQGRYGEERGTSQCAAANEAAAAGKDAGPTAARPTVPSQRGILSRPSRLRSYPPYKGPLRW
jgi:hypothetical protein